MTQVYAYLFVSFISVRSIGPQQNYCSTLTRMREVFLRAIMDVGGLIQLRIIDYMFVMAVSFFGSNWRIFSQCLLTVFVQYGRSSFTCASEFRAWLLFDCCLTNVADYTLVSYILMFVRFYIYDVFHTGLRRLNSWLALFIRLEISALNQPHFPSMLPRY